MRKPAFNNTLWAKLCFLFSLSLLIARSASAQCDLTNLRHITYDTLIIGTANDEYSINLPQFDPSIGTLVSVKLNSTISLNYGFTLQNVEAVQRDFTVQVVRDDNFTSSALNDPYSNEVDTSIGEFLLNPNDIVSKNPYTVLYRFSQNDSITSNVVPFLGNNNVAFDYTTLTYANLYGSSQYAFNASANDTIRFSVTYYYCENTVLANNLVSFSADKESSAAVKLSWSTTGLQQGVGYQIQAGSNNTELFSIDSVAGINGTDQYSYDYKIANNASGKIYFRLKIINPSGEIKYSEIKSIDLTNNDDSVKAFIYPNPAINYINIQLPKNDWDVKIYTTLGILAQQYHFSNTSLAHISFENKLLPGTYFIKDQGIKSNINEVFSFVIK